MDKNINKEAMMEIFKRYEKCLRWLGQGYKDGEEPGSKNGVCPECGNELVKRTGAYGTFFACSDTECRYAEKVEPGMITAAK